MWSKSVPIQMEELSPLRDAVEEECRRLRISEDVISQVGLILEELFVNSASYSGPSAAERGFEIQVGRHKNDLLLTVADETAPFNPLMSAPPNLEGTLEEREPGGLGLYFVKQLATRLDYERMGNRNVLKITIAV